MIKRIKQYIQNIILEWQKVSKPDAQQVRGSTIAVLIASALLGLYIWLVDGSGSYPTWESPLTLLLLLLIPIAVFFIGGDALAEKRFLIAAITCIPLIVVLINNYVFKLAHLKGFGMSFLRDLFLR